MENASKALIIAGAILLAIVIISLGLVVVNNTRSVTDNTNLSEQELQTFNAKFTSFAGDSISGSRVNTLIQTVISTNQELSNNGAKDGEFVEIIFPSISAENDANGKYYRWILGIFDSSSGTNAGKIISAQADKWDATRPANPSSALGSSASVSTGKYYTVKIEYSKGKVHTIRVKAN